MTEWDQILDETISRFERIVNKVYAMERTPKDFGTGEHLHGGQVNTIVAVGKNPRISITELSNELGITKGTVSQVVKNLEKRAYLKRTRPPDNGKAVLVELTSKGEMVFDEHEKYHREFFSDYFEGITFAQAAIFNEILGKIEAYADGKIRRQR